MQRRKLEELNLLDDFLFGSMVTYPEIGEKFIREILRTIFKREFGKLTVVPQKIYYGSDTDRHGARLDVYLEEEMSGGAATVYDVEPDQNNDAEALAALPFRIRFYHAKIDAKSLKAGESYRLLKKVIVIMIMPYDPFGRDRMVYTIRNVCEEEPDMPYDDGARTLFLYTKGTKGNPAKELRELLHYMEDTTEVNAQNKSLQGIHEMVQIVRQDEEVSLEYMKIFEREEMLIRQGIKQGIEQGI
ncbi:MAG: Rpn family recombination-promoting nuclease/putative transposase, partial [Lachnospiraceae bacterium]|nr:Rpn family recombination-promoting nuclease/putative transposase [Lachnospiraceae bacterium]